MRESFLFQVLNLGALTPVVLESAYQEHGRRREGEAGRDSWAQMILQCSAGLLLFS